MLKKKVLIYSEYWSSRGGGEKYMLYIIETLLKHGYDVTIAASATFDKISLSQYFRVNIECASVMMLGGDVNAMRAAAESASSEFDICLYITNFRFFNSRARQTFCVLQIPYGPISPLTIVSKAAGGHFKEAGKDFYRMQLLNRLKETHAVLVYSKYVHDALDAIHDVPSTVLPPAIDDFLLEGGVKERIILSVGRFFRGLYNDKRYDVLIDAFKKLCQRLPNTTWQYRLVGSCGSDSESQEYLAQLRESAKGFPIYFHINSPYDELKRHYNEATLFWHAAGFEADERRYPERAEHFGMSTIEAMSARTVPVVINRGGQKEIVSHDETGYLWNTTDELVDYSISLIADQALLKKLRMHARERFRDFDREHFSKNLLSIIET